MRGPATAMSSESEKTATAADAPPDDALIFRPVPAAGGFVYQLPDGRRLARDVMERLADTGMLRRIFAERVNVCSKCDSGSVLFREVCPHCQGPGVEQPEVIHHFPCAGVFRAELFGDAESLVCPKCRKTLRHVGVDHEYMEAEFVCASCGRASSVVPTYGRCLDCGERFPAEEAGVDDWYEYVPTDKWDNAILGEGSPAVPSCPLPTVLIVDDVEDNLDLLEDILESQSVKLIRASGGAEALEAAGHTALDLIILDVNMPGMDGFEVARRMREMEQCVRVPILFLTAHRTSDNDLVTGLGAGANDYVTKPFDTKDLLSRVDVMLRRGDAAQR